MNLAGSPASGAEPGQPVVGSKTSELIRRADDCVKVSLQNARINFRGFYVGMSTQLLDYADIRAGFKKVSCEIMAQRMGSCSCEFLPVTLRAESLFSNRTRVHDGT